MTRRRDALRAWLGLLKASNRLKKTVDTEFRNQFGLSISRFDVLAALDRAPVGGMRAGDLSQLLMVTEGNTTQVTAPLIRDSLVKRMTCRTDGRVALFELTGKGRRLFKDMANYNRDLIANAFADFSANDLAQLKTLVEKIRIPEHLAKEGEDAA